MIEGNLFERQVGTEPVTVFVPGPVVAQPRQRHTIRYTKQGEPFLANYVSERDPVQGFKRVVQMFVRQAWRGGPVKGPVSLVAVFVFPRPQRLKEGGRAWHVCKPDSDNLVKAVKDALTQIVWVDDSQVCEECVRKRYAATGEEEGVELTIRRLEPYAAEHSRGVAPADPSPAMG